jgi:hypothetical protein
MNYKSQLILVALLLLALPHIVASVVVVGDNQPWDQYAFSSSFKLNLYASETVSFYVQFTGTDTINFYLYDSTGAILQTLSCATSPCSQSFDPANIISSGLYSMTIIPPGGFGAALGTLPLEFPVG